MPSRVFFKYRTNVYCTDLGLKKAVVIADSAPGKESLLFDCLMANDFWIYVTRCYGKNEGCLGYYTIPSNHSEDFQRFVACLKDMGVARNVETYWSTCCQGVSRKTNWFDEQSKQWVLPWDKWIDEIPVKETQLPRTLMDPKDYPVKGDGIDVFILKELEKNPTISLINLAKTMGMSQQLVEYHYRKHILDRNLIESFEVRTRHFDMSVSDMFVFTFWFDKPEKCARFANSLLDKPFVGGVGKILGEKALIVDIYLPRQEFRRFVDVLSKAIQRGLLLSFNHLVLDLRGEKTQTISYENFKDRKWRYDHQKHIRNLRNLLAYGTRREEIEVEA